MHRPDLNIPITGLVLYGVLDPKENNHALGFDNFQGSQKLNIHRYKVVRFSLN